jgi:hypothetical protein
MTMKLIQAAHPLTAEDVYAQCEEGTTTFVFLVEDQSEAQAFAECWTTKLGDPSHHRVFAGLEPGSRVAGISTRETVPMVMSLVGRMPIGHCGLHEPPDRFFRDTQEHAAILLRDPSQDP